MSEVTLDNSWVHLGLLIDRSGSMEQMDKLDLGIINLERNLLDCRDSYLYDSCYEATNVYLNFLLKEKRPLQCFYFLF